MNNLPSIQESHTQLQSFKKERFGIKLPDEILKYIFSYLDALGLQQTTSVSQVWKKTAIISAKHREFSLIKNFMDSVNEKINQKAYPEQIHSFEINNANCILESVNLKQVKYSIFTIRDKILNVLQYLDDEDFKDLTLNWDENAPYSSFFFLSNIFTVARIWRLLTKVIQNVKDDPDNEYGIDIACQLAESMAQYGSIKKAIQISFLIPNQVRQEKTLSKIYELSIVMGKTLRTDVIKDVAKEYIQASIHDDRYKKALVRLEKALRISNLVHDYEIRGSIFRDLAPQFIQSGHFETASELSSLADICIEVARCSFEKVLELALTINNGIILGYAFSVIFESLPDNDDRVSELIALRTLVNNAANANSYEEFKAALNAAQKILPNKIINKEEIISCLILLPYWILKK
jgi:tetratricopeptide (TPR) repeat protein